MLCTRGRERLHCGSFLHILLLLWTVRVCAGPRFCRIRSENMLFVINIYNSNLVKGVSTSFSTDCRPIQILMNRTSKQRTIHHTNAENSQTHIVVVASLLRNFNAMGFIRFIWQVFYIRNQWEFGALEGISDSSLSTIYMQRARLLYRNYSSRCFCL